MQAAPKPSQLTSKFAFLYTKLLQGQPPERLDANGDAQRLFSDLLNLNVDAAWLTNQLQQLPKDAILGRLKVRSTFKIGGDIAPSLTTFCSVAILQVSVQFLSSVCFRSGIWRGTQGPCARDADYRVQVLFIKELCRVGGDGTGCRICGAERPCIQCESGLGSGK
jgi:hypothetical protein